jgi:hypothetical protein
MLQTSNQARLQTPIACAPSKWRSPCGKGTCACSKRSPCVEGMSTVRQSRPQLAHYLQSTAHGSTPQAVSPWARCWPQRFSDSKPQSPCHQLCDARLIGAWLEGYRQATRPSGTCHPPAPSPVTSHCKPIRLLAHLQC